MKMRVLGLFLLSSSLAYGSSYEHPLQRGGGHPATRPDFTQRFNEFISHKGSGRTGEELLHSYYAERRNPYFPDLILAFGRGQADPVMSLLHRGRATNRLPNEAFLYVVVFVEEGAPVLGQKPVVSTPAVMTAEDSRDICLKEPRQLCVRLEGLAYEKEKDSGINAMEVIKLYTGKEPQRYGQRPLAGACAAVDMTRAEPLPGTTIRKAIIKFTLEKESMYRLNVQQTGREQSSEIHFANMRLSWFSAGVGAGAVNKRDNFTKAAVKPYLFGHVYVSKRLNEWNRSLAVAAGIPIENKVEEAMVGLRWSPANEWTSPDLSRFGLVLGGQYHRPTGEFVGRRQWRLLAGLDYKL